MEPGKVSLSTCSTEVMVSTFEEGSGKFYMQVYIYTRNAPVPVAVRENWKKSRAK